MKSKIHLGIDASNISGGGGVTHLSCMLHNANLGETGIGHVTLWASKEVAKLMPIQPWLDIKTPEWLEASLPVRFLCQQFLVPGLVKKSGCDILFSPAGTLPFFCRIPTVTMSQNLLPFEPYEAALFGSFSWLRLKMYLLKWIQVASFRGADGIIFLTKYARNKISSQLKNLSTRSVTIAHGIEPRFFCEPRLNCGREYTKEHPLKILYVSTLMPYKHQMEVVDAIFSLRKIHIPVEITFIGDSWGWYGDLFQKKISELDPHQEYLKYLGVISFCDLHQKYHDFDIFLFASSCENLPNILIEAMASGMPIVCSNAGPMEEVLGDSGIYFDPRDPEQIAQLILMLFRNPLMRQALAQRARLAAEAYNWGKCADETLGFIGNIAANPKEIADVS